MWSSIRVIITEKGVPDSTALRYTNKGNIYKAATYGSDGRIVARIDFIGAPHKINGISTLHHVHTRVYQGIGYKKDVISLIDYLGRLPWAQV